MKKRLKMVISLERRQLLLIGVFLIAFLVRVIQLGQIGFTYDEKYNISRGRMFGSAVLQLFDGEFNPDAWFFKSPQREAPLFANHPGVTVAYLAGIGVIIAFLNGTLFGEFPTYLFAFRLPFAVIGALTCVILSLLGEDLFDNEVGFLAGLMLALEPFHISLSRIIGLDSPLAFFFLLTLWTFNKGVHNRGWLYISGITMGLATLIKIQAGILVPALLLWHLIFSGQKNYVDRIKVSIFHLILWSVFALLTFYLLWPWMWPDPFSRTYLWLNQTTQLWTGVEDHFFMGNFIRDPPFYGYLLILALRLTGPEFLGIIFFLIALFIDQSYTRFAKKRNAFLALSSFFLICMSAVILLEIKLRTRYLLLFFPILLIFSALGWLFLVNKLQKALMSYAKNFRAEYLRVLSIIVILGLQAYPLLSESPNYYYEYYNPLLGGGRVASRVEVVGWGEGLNEMAEYLNTKSQSSSTKYHVAVFGYSSIFNRYFDGPSSPDFDEEAASVAEILDNYDYVVFQLNYIQKNPDNLIWSYFKYQKPEYSIEAYGLTIFWLFRASS